MPGGEPESEEQIAVRNVWHAANLRGVAIHAIGQEPGWVSSTDSRAPAL